MEGAGGVGAVGGGEGCGRRLAAGHSLILGAIACMGRPPFDTFAPALARHHSPTPEASSGPFFSLPHLRPARLPARRTMTVRLDMSEKPPNETYEVAVRVVRLVRPVLWVTYVPWLYAEPPASLRGLLRMA